MKKSAFWGAAFLMATSAIGPGFITQTAVFTAQMWSSFGFIILCSIVIDLIAQVNIWRIIAVSRLPAQEVANRVQPGLGHLLAFLVALGGLAFNIGNVAGAGLGLQVLTGLPVAAGAMISAALSLAIFWVREAGRAMDWFARALGFVMIGLTLYVAFRSHPPLGEALYRTVWPSRFSVAAVVTLVGGTVGGYISFAGAHRLLEAGLSGSENLRSVTGSSIRAIMLASLMRILLFLAALGVVIGGASLGTDNPAAEVFRLAAGGLGYRLFGLVLWAAAITSVVGSAFTSVSFLKTMHAGLARNHRWVVTGFIVFSTLIFLVVGRPVTVLIAVGALNGLILPVALACMLLAVRRPAIVGNYRANPWLSGLGWGVVVLMSAMGGYTMVVDLWKLL